MPDIYTYYYDPLNSALQCVFDKQPSGTLFVTVYDTRSLQTWSQYTAEYDPNGYLTYQFLDYRNGDTVVNQYDTSNGQIMYQFDHFPDGTQDNFVFDTQNQQNFSSYQTEYNTSGQATTQFVFCRSGDVVVNLLDTSHSDVQYVFDHHLDGTQTNITFDTAGTNAWSSYSALINTSSQVVSQVVEYRSGDEVTNFFNVSNAQVVEALVSHSDGSSDIYAYDTNGTDNWSSYSWHYDSSGHATSETIHYRAYGDVRVNTFDSGGGLVSASDSVSGFSAPSPTSDIAVEELPGTVNGVISDDHIPGPDYGLGPAPGPDWTVDPGMILGPVDNLDPRMDIVTSPGDPTVAHPDPAGPTDISDPEPEPEFGDSMDDPIVLNIDHEEVQTAPLSGDQKLAFDFGQLTQGEGFLVSVSGNGALHFISSIGALNLLDTNEDSHIDQSDSGFNSLAVLYPASSGAGSQMTLLTAAGVTDLDLHQEVQNAIDNGNLIHSVFNFSYGDGSVGQGADVWLASHVNPGGTGMAPTALYPWEPADPQH